MLKVKVVVLYVQQSRNRYKVIPLLLIPHCGAGGGGVGFPQGRFGRGGEISFQPVFDPQTVQPLASPYTD